VARTATVAALEAAGVVAVIRLKDAGKLRGVVDALVEGGVRALEVTMTVPGAVESHSRDQSPRCRMDFCWVPAR
jgi:2-dehydro-3-deoxyphosphogluconate aldolase/(4S)-4-hydroxy-2-oxoglutarate aldolase